MGRQEEKTLNSRQVLFCNEYLKDNNGTRAYMAAYKTCKKKATAAVNATNLLKQPKIQQYLQHRREIIENECNITQKQIITELSNIAFSANTDYVKASDKLKALELIGKNIGMFTDGPQVQLNQLSIGSLKDMSDADLRQLAALRKPKLIE